jgi:DNA-binding NarL/FixJ family response regulator
LEDAGREAEFLEEVSTGLKMSKSGQIRVLVADDHPVVRFGLVAIIDAQPNMTVAAEAEDGHEAVKLYQRVKPDLALIDLQLPGMSGLNAIRAILQEHPAARVVVLTTYEGDEDIHRALEAGAQGYVIKAMSHQVLLEAINKVFSGKRFVPEPVIQRLAARTPNSDLTPREHQVLSLIVNGKSNREISNLLGITEGTVKCHVNVILARLDVSDRTQAAVAALQRGIVHLDSSWNS